MIDNMAKIAYFGADAFIVTTSKNKKILIDPYITDNPACHKDLDYFCDVDLILVTHGAFDHMGDAIEIMRKSKAFLICGPDVATHAQQMDIPKERVAVNVYGGEREFEGIRVKAVDARHVSKIDSKTETIYGVPLGFVISLENGIRIYHTGDTSLFGDLKLIGMLYRPHILMIGISCVSKGHIAEMNTGEAALATLWVAPDIVIPMHYPPGSDDPLNFREAVSIVAPNVEPVIMEPGSQITYRRYRFEAD